MTIRNVNGRNVYVLEPRPPTGKTTSGKAWATLYSDLRWQIWEEIQKNELQKMKFEALTYDTQQKVYLQAQKDIRNAITELQQARTDLSTGGLTARSAASLAAKQADLDYKVAQANAQRAASSQPTLTYKISPATDLFGKPDPNLPPVVSRTLSGPVTMESARGMLGGLPPETAQFAGGIRIGAPEVGAVQAAPAAAPAAETISVDGYTRQQRQTAIEAIDKDIANLRAELEGLQAPEIGFETDLLARTRRGFEQDVGVMGQGGGPFGLAARPTRTMPRVDEPLGAQRLEEFIAAFDGDVDAAVEAMRAAGAREVPAGDIFKKRGGRIPSRIPESFGAEERVAPIDDDAARRAAMDEAIDQIRAEVAAGTAPAPAAPAEVAYENLTVPQKQVLAETPEGRDVLSRLEEEYIQRKQASAPAAAAPVPSAGLSVTTGAVPGTSAPQPLPGLPMAELRRPTAPASAAATGGLGVTTGTVPGTSAPQSLGGLTAAPAAAGRTLEFEALGLQPDETAAALEGMASSAPMPAAVPYGAGATAGMPSAAMPAPEPIPFEYDIGPLINDIQSFDKDKGQVMEEAKNWFEASKKWATEQGQSTRIFEIGKPDDEIFVDYLYYMYANELPQEMPATMRPDFNRTIRQEVKNLAAEKYDISVDEEETGGARRQRGSKEDRRKRYKTNVIQRGTRLSQQPDKVARLAKTQAPREQRPKWAVVVDSLYETNKNRGDAFKTTYDEVVRAFASKPDARDQALEYLVAKDILENDKKSPLA